MSSKMILCILTLATFIAPVCGQVQGTSSEGHNSFSMIGTSDGQVNYGVVSGTGAIYNNGVPILVSTDPEGSIAPAAGGDVSMTAGLIWVGTNGWIYEADNPPLEEPCQSPDISLNLAYNNYLIKNWLDENGWTQQNINSAAPNLRYCGDCDNFVVMLAYFIQEHAHFDTCVVLHEGINGQAGHAACLIRYEPDALDVAAARGWGYTHIDNQGQHWRAIDMKLDGSIPTFPQQYMNTIGVTKEWYELVGKPDRDFGLAKNSP